jgi:TonB family protein
VLERAQGAELAPVHVNESPLDTVLDMYERSAREFTAQHEGDRSAPRDIRGRSFSDDVHDYVEILKKEVPGITASSKPDAASQWADLQRQRFAWLQAYWQESVALMNNRDLWHPFLDKNHLASTMAHNAGIGDAERALLAALNTGIPSEEWATRARALKEAYISERVNIVLYNRNPSSNSTPLTPRSSPCPPAATTTSGSKAPRLADNGHSLEDFWPMESKRRDEEGTVVVVVRISATGCMIGSAVIGSSGSDLLDGAVRRYLDTSIWIPAGATGAPVEYTATMPIKFKLH